MWTIDGLETFLKNNNEVISVLIGILSIVVSLCGVYFGRKAYHVAKEIFEKGLRIDQQKVLQQISLDFVTGFFIPLSKFKIATKSILVNSCDTQSVLHVRDLIIDNTFSVQFPYFDVHKGDVWDALIICKDMEQSEAFNTIMDFVEKARSFDRAITDLYGRLNDYLNPNDAAESQRRAAFTLKDFFDTCPSVNQISLDFVTGFFIPLSKFKIATKSILVNSCDTQSVLHVRDLIIDNTFSVQFPYFDVHKGDVWDALIICKDMEQSEAFNTIMDFVEKARSFDRAITDLYGRLNDYLNPNDAAESQRRAAFTLKDFFDTCPSVNQDMFNKGLKMIDDLSQYENKLPKELKIPEMKRKLFRD